MANPQQIEMPIMPPNPTPEQQQAWAMQMQAWASQAQGGQPTLPEMIAKWFGTNIGTPGSSRATFDPKTGRMTNGVAAQTQPSQTAPVQQRAVQNALKDPGPAPKGGDIVLPPSGPPHSTYGPYANGYQIGNDQQVQDLVNIGTGGNLSNAGVPADLSTNPQLGTGYNNIPLSDIQPHVSSDYFNSARAYEDPQADSGNFLSGMSNQDWLGVGGLGLMGIGSYLGAKQQGKQFDQQFAENQRQFDTSNALQQQQLAGNQSQLNPYKQQEDLYSAAVKGALGQYGPAQVQLGSTVPLDPARPAIGEAAKSYLNPEALAGAKSTFDTNMGAAQQKLALENALKAQPKKKEGGGFWKTLGKIGAFAAPIIAAPFTGGASLAAIGALSGAAGGALSGGGVKGALLGAGLGAIPGFGTSKGLAQGAAAPALSQGLKQAGKSALKRPATALAIMNALK